MVIGLPEASGLLACLHTVFIKDTKAHWDKCWRTTLLFVQHTNRNIKDGVVISSDSCTGSNLVYQSKLVSLSGHYLPIFMQNHFMYYIGLQMCMAFLIMCFCFFLVLLSCASMLFCAWSHPMSFTGKLFHSHYLPILVTWADNDEGH